MAIHLFVFEQGRVQCTIVHACYFKLKLRIMEDIRGRRKSGSGVKSSNFSANIGPTETYYIPNQWKLNKAFAKVCRLEIAALIE